ncbi:MAG: ABC transporter permease [Vulcanimicrobiaceae bacterium]
MSFDVRRVRVQCVKELLQFRRDRLTVALAFGLPLGMLLIFGLAIRLEIKDIPIAVQDLDRTPLSRDFVSRLSATEELRVTLLPAALRAIDPLDAGSARATVVIPPGTARLVQRGQNAPLGVLIDSTDVVNAMTIREAIRATAQFFDMQLAPPDAFVPAVAANVRIWFNPGRREALNIVPGVYAVVLAMYPALLAAMAMVRERERGTIVQAYASRLSAAELLAGKSAAFLLVGLGQVAVVMGVGSLVWQLGFVADPTLMLVATPLFVLDSVLFGLLVGSSTTSVSAAVQGVGSVNAFFNILLTGFLYPLSNMPYALQVLSFIVPARYFIEVSRDAFVRGAGWQGFAAALPALVLIGAVYFTLAWLRLRRMQFAA